LGFFDGPGRGSPGRSNARWPGRIVPRRFLLSSAWPHEFTLEWRAVLVTAEVPTARPTFPNRPTLPRSRPTRLEAARRLSRASPLSCRSSRAELPNRSSPGRGNLARRGALPAHHVTTDGEGSTRSSSPDTEPSTPRLDSGLRKTKGAPLCGRTPFASRAQLQGGSGAPDHFRSPVPKPPKPFRPFRDSLAARSPSSAATRSRRSSCIRWTK
jgi:hypothetical protein